MSSWYEPPDRRDRRRADPGRVHELVLWVLLVLACGALLLATPVQAAGASSPRRCPIVLQGWEDGGLQAPREEPS